MKIPHVSTELIEFLEQIYPLRSPKMDETERSIFVRVGHQEVIAMLKKHYADQTRRSMLGQ